MTAYGWRIARVPAKPVRRDADGRVSVPLWLLRDGRYHADLDLRLTSDEAEVLRVQLGQVLDEKREGMFRKKCPKSPLRRGIDRLRSIR